MASGPTEDGAAGTFDTLKASSSQKLGNNYSDKDL